MTYFPTNSTLTKMLVLFPRQFPAASTTCGRFPHMNVHKDCPFPGLMVEVGVILCFYN